MAPQEHECACLEAVDTNAAAPACDKAPSLKGAEADAAGMVVGCVPGNHASLQQHDQPAMRNAGAHHGTEQYCQ